MGADTSGYAIGGVCGQCDKDNGKLMPLMYYTAHLQPHQCHWHSYEQELWGLLNVVREKVKQLGRIPCIVHTDHANLARLDSLALERIDPKHFRWFAEVTQGGSLLIHRPGAGTAHRGPDGLSRNAEGRDKLILAKGSEWKSLRDRIRGIMKAIVEGRGDDEDDHPISIEHLSKTDPEKLEPLPQAEGLEVSRRYEQGNRDHKSQKFSRGGLPPRLRLKRLLISPQ